METAYNGAALYVHAPDCMVTNSAVDITPYSGCFGQNIYKFYITTQNIYAKYLCQVFRRRLLLDNLHACRNKASVCTFMSDIYSASSCLAQLAIYILVLVTHLPM